MVTSIDYWESKIFDTHFRPHDGEPAERAERVDGAVRLREHQLPLLQPHAQHRPQPTQLK